MRERVSGSDLVGTSGCGWGLTVGSVSVLYLAGHGQSF